MPSYSIVTVRDSFKSMNTEILQSIAKLQNVIAETQRYRTEVETPYEKKLNRYVKSLFVPKLNKDVLAVLNRCSSDEFDFSAIYTAKMEESKRAEIELNALTVSEGDISDLRAKEGKLASDMGSGYRRIYDLESSITAQEKVLKKVELFNSQTTAGQAKIDQDGIKYFSPKSGFAARAWTYVTDSHYRQGRALIEEYQQKGLSITDLQSQLTSDKTAVQETSRHMQELEQKRFGIEQTIKNMEKVENRIQSEADIKNESIATVLELFEDDSFMNAVAADTGTAFPAELVEARAKIDSFKKVEQTLSLRVSSLRAASSQLEEPMSKLNKAISRNVRKDISINLDDIKKKMTVTNIMAAHSAVENQKISSSIHSFRPSTGTNTYYQSSFSPLDFYMQWIILDMLMDNSSANGPDNFAIQSTLGIPDNLAQEAHIDLAQLTPQFSNDFVTEMGGLTANFNIANDNGSLFSDISAGNIDVPNVSIDMPSVTVDIPSISLPSTDYSGGSSSNYDSGSSSSYDSGGGGGGGGGFD